LLAKRAMDLILGTFFALLAVPIILVLAIGVTISLRAWPFFVQGRIGKGGKPFRLPKIRTLPTSVSPYIDKYSLNGTRVPRLCEFLRRSHIDELPQLFLVPFGKLSLVGPRPKMPDWAEPIDPEYGKLRTQVRQGCTGLWQISEHNGRCVAETPEYDLLYASRATLRTDVWILMRTAFMFMGLARPISLDQVPDFVLASGFVTIASVAAQAAGGSESADVVGI
jgi:lipopolysaccharide/colanic/teichoic acid biosynthesis glycosyltransferase